MSGGRAHGANIAIPRILDRRFSKFISLLALPFAVLAFLAPIAHATYDPVGSGTVRLVLDKGLASFLKRNGITLVAKAGAKKKGASFSFPVIEGNLDTTIGKGEIDTEGTLLFQSAGKKVPLRNIVVRTKSTPLIAKVGGSQLKVASSRKLSSRRQGFGTGFSAKALKLSAKVVTRLNKKLRPRFPFLANQPLGTLRTHAEPRLTSILAQNKATLLLDPAFVAKLDEHFVSVNPIFPAEHVGSTFTLPIVGGGAIAPNGSEGELRTGGEMEFLQLGGGQIFWREQWLEIASRGDTAEVEIRPSPPYPGKLGRVGVLEAASLQLSADPARRTISGSGIQLSLSASAAQAFDEAFAAGKGDFSAGELAGVLGFTAQGQ
jgi:hypothetical protein